MVIVLKVEESASMRRKLAKHKSNQGEKAGNNLRSDTRHTNIASKEGPSRELSSLPIYNGEVFLNVLRNQIFVVMVAILAILFVFVGNGQASSNLVTTPIGLETHEKAGFSLKPRIVHYITTNNVVVKSRIQSIMKMPVEFLVKKEVEFLDRKDNEPEEESDSSVRLSDSEEYGKKPEPMYTEDPPCEPQYAWQEQSLPICNIFHESDMTEFLSPTSDDRQNGDAELFRFIANGGYRDVYMIRDHNSSWNKLALKTLRWTRDFTERHFDRHRRDAVVADRLTALPTSVDIYGFCGQSAIYEFAKGGDLKRAILKHVTNPKVPSQVRNCTQ